MTAIDILYIVTEVVSVGASIPQVIRLFREKQSDEFSISTWSMWLCCQVAFLAYVLSRSEGLMVFFSSIWLMFYVAMFVMIVYYRRHPGMVTQLNSHQNELEMIPVLEQDSSVKGS